LKLISKKEALTGFLFLLVLTSVVGCVSIDSSEYRQTVLVKSNPPGAVILENGERIGVTPEYVRVRRRSHPKLTLVKAGEAERTVELETHYRWADSFFSDFLFLRAAPVAWGIDYLTGNAWRMDDPLEVEFEPGHALLPIHPTDVVAVAPPEVADPDIADAIGLLVENKLSTEYSVLPYARTAPLFNYYGSNQGLSSDPELRDNLLYQLPAKQIFLSKAVPEGDGYKVSGQLTNKFTGDKGDTHSWTISPESGELKEEFTTHEFFARHFRFLPNTLFLSFSNYQASLDVDNTPVNGRALGNRTFGEQAINYLSAISLQHLDRPSTWSRAHWVFEFVPSFDLSRKRIAFNGYAPLQDVEFDRWYVSGGYGIEVGHQSKIGLFYVDFIPNLTWTQLSFTAPQGDETISNTSLTATFELGYSYFITQHLVGRIFGRTVTEDSELWGRAVSDITGRAQSVSGVNSVFSGISIGYYIPSALRGTSGWKVDRSKTY
jgi:hypothetical protein